MQQRKIIIFLVVLFILSSLWLSFVSQNLNNPDYQKNWWAVYFSDPNSSDFNFTIENHSDNANFHWEISDGKTKIIEGDAMIERGSTKKLDIDSSVEKFDNKRTTITVSSGDEKKEIYKNNE